MICTSDIYFWRQTIVFIADCIHSIGTGFVLAFPSVLNPELFSPYGYRINTTPEQASWIAASHGLSGVVGFCLVPHLMQALGPKVVQIGLNALVSIGFLIFALANSVTVLYLARITQGLAMCSIYVTSIILEEYSHPKRRRSFITLKNCSILIGSLMCHALGETWMWKQIAILATFPHIIAIILTFLWPESPAFLALNGRYDECENSHTWLYGDSLQNKRDLKELIATQMERRQENNELKRNIRAMLKKDFIRQLVIVSLLTMLIDACGRHYMLAYGIQIFMETTRHSSIAANCTMVADVLTIIAFIISCFVIRCCKRRPLLFTSGIISLLLMILISLTTILEQYDNPSLYLYWLTPCIILLNVFVVNVGVIPVCFVIIGEIFTLENKHKGLCATGIVFSILYTLVMKFTPLMMEETGVRFTFGIYGLFVFAGLLILYFILNETKAMTLQEIDNEIKGVKPSKLLHLYEQPLIHRSVRKALET